MTPASSVRPAFVLLGLAWLAGCAVDGGMPAGYVAVPGVAATTTGQHFIVLNGFPEQHAPPFLGVAGTNFEALRSLIDRTTGEAVQQLYVTDSYPAPERGWDAAYDGAGRKLPFVPIGHHEIACEPGCLYVEDFAADLPPAVLEANPHGFAVTFAARSGARQRIRVGARQVAAQRTAFARARALLTGIPAMAGPSPTSSPGAVAAAVTPPSASPAGRGR